MDIKQIEKLFGNIAREVNRVVAVKWEKVYVVASMQGEKIETECLYTTAAFKKGNKNGSKILNGYFEKYREEVIRVEGKGWNEMVLIINSSGHVDMEFVFDEVKESFAERIEFYKEKYI